MYKCTDWSKELDIGELKTCLTLIFVQSSRVPHPGWSDGLPGGSGLRLSPGGGQADAEPSFSHRETG